MLLKCVKKVARPNLNCGNLIQAINTWAVSLTRYEGGIIECRTYERQDLDRRTRKLLTVMEGSIPNCVARPYFPRKEEGRGLTSAEKCVNEGKISLECNAQSSAGGAVISSQERRE